jgi:hypothetical protein
VHTTFARGAGVIVAGFALTSVFGTGTAGATNEYVGQTFNDAASAIASSGQSYRIQTRFGTFLPTGACIVSGSRVNSSNGIVQLDLNCNYMFALPGVPGNSMGNEAGRTARAAAVEQITAQQAEAQAKAEAEAAEQKDLPEGG